MPGFFDVLKEPPVQFPGQEYPIFNRISIETISYCNRKCVFCPVAWNDRGHTSMADSLYDKVINELGQLKFDGVAQLFLLSEPMIDVKLPDRARALRAACPDVSIYISSNGDVLDKIAIHRGLDAALERLDSYYQAGINVININSYDPGAAQLDRYRELEYAAGEKLGCKPTGHKYRWHRPKGKYLCITDMRFDEREEVKGTDVFYLRNAQDRAKLKANGEQVPQLHCMRTQRHLVVLFDGRVPICCAIDPNDETLIAGDVNSQTLWQVWQSEPFFKYRYYTQQGKRVLPGCDTCTHRMAFPHVVRKVDVADETAATWQAELTKTPKEMLS